MAAGVGAAARDGGAQDRRPGRPVLSGRGDRRRLQPARDAGRALEEAFADDPHWPDLAAAIEANRPAAGAGADSTGRSCRRSTRCSLDAIVTERVARTARAPAAAGGSAWATAQELTRWASRSWEHSGSSHVEWKDAAHILERTRAGERFACKEYTVVLTQALNAVGIPARSVGLFREYHHVGLGRAHMVTEAWIDDLAGWVVLDGQNGAYWADESGPPRGRSRCGRAFSPAVPPPRSWTWPVAARPPPLWWPYFRTVGLTAFALSATPFAPRFEEPELDLHRRGSPRARRAAGPTSSSSGLRTDHCGR